MSDDIQQIGLGWAYSRLRERAEEAQHLEWEAVKDLEAIGFSDSTVALAVADLLQRLESLAEIPADIETAALHIAAAIRGDA